MSSTTLSEATILPTAARSKSKKFTLLKHDYIGIAFALLAMSPMFLALTNKALAIWIASGGWPVFWSIVGFEPAVLLLAAVRKLRNAKGRCHVNGTELGIMFAKLRAATACALETPELLANPEGVEDLYRSLTPVTATPQELLAITQGTAGGGGEK